MCVCRYIVIMILLRIGTRRVKARTLEWFVQELRRIPKPYDMVGSDPLIRGFRVKVLGLRVSLITLGFWIPRQGLPHHTLHAMQGTLKHSLIRCSMSRPTVNPKRRSINHKDSNPKPGTLKPQALKAPHSCALKTVNRSLSKSFCNNLVTRDPSMEPYGTLKPNLNTQQNPKSFMKPSLNTL